MAEPPSILHPGPASPDPMRLLRRELDHLADALVDAEPSDRPALLVRVHRTVDTERRCGEEHSALARLLEHMLSDLSGDAASLDTVYYARQLVVHADRLSN